LINGIGLAVGGSLIFLVNIDSTFSNRKRTLSSVIQSAYLAPGCKSFTIEGVFIES